MNINNLAALLDRINPVRLALTALLSCDILLVSILSCDAHARGGGRSLLFDIDHVVRAGLARLVLSIVRQLL